MIDYRELLKKYMRLVVDSEGITFLDFIDDEFSSDEEAALIEIQREVTPS